jgi:hypothetical protein
MPWYGDGRRPACAEAQAKDLRAQRGGGTMQYEMRHASLEGRRGGEPTALTSRRWGASRTDAEAGATPWAQRAVQSTPAERPARRWRSGARPSYFSAGQHDLDYVFLQKVEMCDKTVDTKVVGETSHYNFCKGRPMFFSTVWAGTWSKVGVLQSADEQWKLQLTKFFTFFRSKFEMPSNMKVVFLEKLDNFYIGRIWSV